MEQRRIRMMLTLLALALPTAALANSIAPPPPFSFAGGTVASGLLTGQNALVWNTGGVAGINVVGSMFGIRIDTTSLRSGCQTNGTCAWTGVSVGVRSPSDVTVFMTSREGGTLTKNGDAVTIMGLVGLAGMMRRYWELLH